MQVRRWHEGVGTDEKPAWACGYASGGCVSRKLRPTACGRQCSGAAEEVRARGQRLKDWGCPFRSSLGMPWPQHWHQARPMGHRVRNYPTSPYPRPSARVITEASRVRVSGCGLGFAARLCHELVRTALAGTGAYILTTPNRCARVVVFSRQGTGKWHR